MVKKRDKIVIELKNVFKYYYMGDNIVKAIDGLSIKIKKGEFEGEKIHGKWYVLENSLRKYLGLWYKEE